METEKGNRESKHMTAKRENGNRKKKRKNWSWKIENESVGNSESAEASGPNACQCRGRQLLRSHVANPPIFVANFPPTLTGPWPWRVKAACPLPVATRVTRTVSRKLFGYLLHSFFIFCSFFFDGFLVWCLIGFGSQLSSQNQSN